MKIIAHHARKEGRPNYGSEEHGVQVEMDLPDDASVPAKTAAYGQMSKFCIQLVNQAFGSVPEPTFKAERQLAKQDATNIADSMNADVVALESPPLPDGVTLQEARAAIVAYFMELNNDSKPAAARAFREATGASSSAALSEDQVKFYFREFVGG
jgi:hypothetical protein